MQLHSADYGIIFRILSVKTFVPERCAIFCWQVMKMFHLFLTSGSLKGVLYYSLKIYFFKQARRIKLMIRARRRSYSASYGIIFRILLVKTLVPERCAIFCWQVMKMFHLFLTSGSLKGVLLYIIL